MQGKSRGSSAIARSVAAVEDQSLLESIALRGSRTPRSWEDDAIQIPVTQESTHAKNGTVSPLGVCQIRLAKTLKLRKNEKYAFESDIMDIQNVVSSYGFNEQGTDFMSTMASGDGMRKFSTSLLT